ncbi:hypothetical protein DFH05DRAFT_963315 [Lentinula detonsa]|uniref:Uncharacterized protein n=1 Tax=Lentinula detonsa TaxID=2804962 RepID=A0A9W8TZQ7_9AGAR|nr:hypothetical protein DFH05DRAFT_963315 [Lentinula detonsa]
MERRATSPSSNSFSDTDSYEDSNSIDEVEATLNNLDDELADTEQALSTWSSQTPSTGYGSYMGSGSGTYTGNGTYTPSGTFTGTNTATQTGQGSYTGSPSFVSLPSLFSPTAGSSSLQSSYPPPSNDPRIRLSHITERTEGTESRPVSGVSYATTVPARPRSAFLSSGAGRHSRSSTDPSDLPPPGRANQLIGLFESGSTSRSPSPTKSNSTFTRSQTPSNLSYSTLLSPPDRPSTATGSSYTPSTFTNTQSTFTQSTLSPSVFTTTQTGTGTGTGITESSAQTQTTPTSTLRRPTRPEGSSRSPLTNVRNVVALWKERTPTREHRTKNPEPEVDAPVSPTPESRGHKEGQGQRGSGGDDDGGLFGLRRRASGKRASADSLGGSVSERISNGSNGGSNIDISELGKFLGGNGTETPLHLGTLYYLNVHAEPPYRWQRCQGLLYRHTLLLSWLAPTTPSPSGPSTVRAPLGRAVVQLDLVNCFAVESALSLSHPRARDDVGAIAAREQDGLSQNGVEIGLIESLVPFWMVYGDGVERLACDSLVQRLRWIERIW